MISVLPTLIVSFATHAHPYTLKICSSRISSAFIALCFIAAALAASSNHEIYAICLFRVVVTISFTLLPLRFSLHISLTVIPSRYLLRQFMFFLVFFFVL